jgi:hypothetical protein
MRKLTPATGLLLGMLLSASAPTIQAAPDIVPGDVWPDAGGQPIQSHGGGVILHSNVFYWYGEDRTPGRRGGVSCYSSTNLTQWKNEGPVFSVADFPAELERRTFIERPKVVFNARTGQFVMWMHAEQGRYTFARAGIATSASPTGPFAFLKAIRPITNDFNFETNDPCRQKEFGGTFRDMNLFVDDDGHAYAFYSSEGNWTMYVVRLNASYTGPEEPAVEGRSWSRILVRRMREAPAPFKHNGRYYLITSACTGWKPNAAGYATADHILGPWKEHPNPCAGPKAETTFDSQSTFVLPVPGKPGSFIYMGDRWNPENLSDSRHIWLPFQIRDDGTFTLEWHDRWSLD